MSLYFGGTCPPGEVEVTTSKGIKVCVHDGGAASVSALKASVAAADTEWSDPFTSTSSGKLTEAGEQGGMSLAPPPMVAVEAGSSGFDWSSTLSSVLDIFGRRVAPQQPVGSALVATPAPMPSWLLPVGIGVGVLALVGMVLASRGGGAPRRRYAGHKRRRSRR